VGRKPERTLEESPAWIMDQEPGSDNRVGSPRPESELEIKPSDMIGAGPAEVDYAKRIPIDDGGEALEMLIAELDDLLNDESETSRFAGMNGEQRLAQARAMAASAKSSKIRMVLEEHTKLVLAMRLLDECDVVDHSTEED